jgi:Undecaprenyl-phosphate glucose phosphotransferase
MYTFVATPHDGNVPILTTFWVVVYWAATWNRRSRQAGQRSDAISVRLSDWLKAAACTLLVAFVTSTMDGISGNWVAINFTAGVCTITLIGVVARAFMFSLAEKGVLGTRVAIYGCGDGTEDLLQYIASDPGSAVHIEKLVDQRIGRSATAIAGYDVSANVDELIGLARNRQIDAVILDLPLEAYDRIDELVHILEQVNVDIIMAPPRSQVRTRSRSVGMIGSIPTVSLYTRPMSGLEALSKIVMDKTMSALALFFLAVPLLLIALLIKIESRGPVLFRQTRRGMNNQPFEMLKFRSMYVDFEDKVAEKLVTRGDVRVTRIGSILRRTSLDELPQLFNVLSGQMSLVGPRPHVWEARAVDRRYEEVVRRYPARHRVLPGLTGLAQVRGFRGNGDDEVEIINRVKSDLEYIDRWDLGLDVVIIARTVTTVLFQRGAY